MKSYEVMSSTRLFRRRALKVRYNANQAFHQRLTSRESSLLDAMYLIPGIMHTATLTEYSVLVQTSSHKNFLSLRYEIERILIAYTGDSLLRMRFREIDIEPKATPWRSANVGPRRIIS